MRAPAAPLASAGAFPASFLSVIPRPDHARSSIHTPWLATDPVRLPCDRAGAEKKATWSPTSDESEGQRLPRADGATDKSRRPNLTALNKAHPKDDVKYNVGSDDDDDDDYEPEAGPSARPEDDMDSEDARRANASDAKRRQQGNTRVKRCRAHKELVAELPKMTSFFAAPPPPPREPHALAHHRRRRHRDPNDLRARASWRPPWRRRPLHSESGCS